MKKRILTIDFLRFGAIFLMFWDHAIKLFFNFGEGFWNQVVSQILNLTSLSSALFLFLVGFSLVLSFKNHQGKIKRWILRKWRRGLILIIWSFILFFYRYNLDYKESMAASGVLELIGLSLISGSLLFLIKKRRGRLILLASLSYLILLTDWALRLKEVEIVLLNAGVFPILPHLFYVLAGMGAGEVWFLYQEKKALADFLKKLFWISLLGVLIIWAAAGFSLGLIFSLRFVTAGFWQPSIILVLFNTTLILFLLSFLALGEKRLVGWKGIRKMSLLGQEALNIYILHILLGWGVARYLLRGIRFGFGAVVLTVMAFCLLGWSWAKVRKIKGNYS